MARSTLFRRRGVSELYASVLMIGVTLSVGSLVTYTAMSQSGLAAGSASLGGALQQSEAGTQLALSYVAVVPSGSCPVYRGFNEGTSLTVALYNYGTGSFTPYEFVVNSTVYQGSYSVLSPGNIATYTVTALGCLHGSGLAILALDVSGGEAQFAS